MSTSPSYPVYTAPNRIDLTTVGNVKSWLSGNGIVPTNTSDDTNIQACITSFSATVLQMTGRGPQDGSFPEASPLCEPIPFDETYDGNNHSRMFLRNAPIQSVDGLTIGNRSIPQSAGYGQAGFVIDGSRKSISLRGGSGTVNFSSMYGCGYIFEEGLQNISVQYTAGFPVVPPDLEMICRKVASLNYKRRDWIGLRSKAMAQGAGTVSYQDYAMEPADRDTILRYQQWW